MHSETSLGSNADVIRIFAVIVLYKKAPEDSVTFQTLQRAKDQLSRNTKHFKVLLYDNSPEGVPQFLPDYVQYRAACGNQGLSGAYNYALEMAESEGFDWLLTLDQDTTLPEDILDQFIQRAQDLSSDNSIGAIVPQLIDQNILLSPRRVLFAHTRTVPRGLVGIPDGEIQAFNSVSLWRISALREIGGFNPYFWLDHLDIWAHHQLYRAKKRIFVAGDIQIEHELSLLDYKRRITLNRFQNFLQAESAFVDLYKGSLEGLALTVRLVCRIYKQKKRGDDYVIQRTTYEALKQRFFQKRSRRIASWKRSMESSFADSNFEGPEVVHPTISVCMAVYNGARFLEEQIRSIRSQLGATGELIVVDDYSSDNTCKIVEGLNDSRIRLIRHSENLGVSRSFEDALSHASGDVIFLSDQDDLWEPTKVSFMMKALRDHPEARVIVSDASLVNEEGSQLGSSYYAVRGNFSDNFLSNLAKCKYLGCLMAFRASLLPEVLPFPSGFDVLHDIWIGSRNRLSGGETLFIDEPLVRYRRHAVNVTGNSKLSLVRQLRTRFDLVAALILFRFRKERP